MKRDLPTRTKRVTAVALSVIMAVTTMLPSGLTSADELDQTEVVYSDETTEQTIETEFVTTEDLTGETTANVTSEDVTTESVTLDDATTEAEITTESVPDVTENIIALTSETGAVVELIAGDVDFYGIKNTEIITRILLDDFWYSKVTEDECITVFGYSKDDLGKGREALIEANKDYYDAEAELYKNYPDETKGYVYNNADSINSVELREKVLGESEITVLNDNGLTKLVSLDEFKDFIKESLNSISEENNDSSETPDNDVESGENQGDDTKPVTGVIPDNNDSESSDDSSNIEEIEEEEEIPVNGIYMSYYDEDEIYELLFTEWAYGFTEEDAQNGFGMTLDEFVAYRKQIKAEKWSEEGYLESLVLADIIELANDEDFNEWVTDEQLLTYFNMDRETFEALADPAFSIEMENIIQVMSITNGRNISGKTWIKDTSNNNLMWVYSWRHNFDWHSSINTDRSATNNSYFVNYCVNNLIAGNGSWDCSTYVKNVLISNGEYPGTNDPTSGTFNTGNMESWLKANNYYSVLGDDFVQLLQGSSTDSGGKSYTAAAANAINTIQNGDILVWAYENADGSFTPKHTSIGVIYRSWYDFANYANSDETFTNGEICVFQSSGSPNFTCDVESVAYYLSGANSGSSYGSALKIYRKRANVGSLSIKKYTTTGNNKEKAVFGLYKVSYNNSSYLVNSSVTAGNPYLNTTSLNLSNMSDTVVNDENGLLTKVATFTTDSSGNTTAKITTAMKNVIANSSAYGSWARLYVDSTGTLQGLPIGDYIVIEEPSTINQTCWKKGGTYGGVTLGSNTVRASYVVTTGGTTKGVNGTQTDFYSGTDASVNKLCDFGFGQGLQYYAAFP